LSSGVAGIPPPSRGRRASRHELSACPDPGTAVGQICASGGRWREGSGPTLRQPRKQCNDPPSYQSPSPVSALARIPGQSHDAAVNRNHSGGGLMCVLTNMTLAQSGAGYAATRARTADEGAWPKNANRGGGDAAPSLASPPTSRTLRQTSLEGGGGAGREVMSSHVPSRSRAGGMPGSMRGAVRSEAGVAEATLTLRCPDGAGAGGGRHTPSRPARCSLSKCSRVLGGR
jgi:hypothetical protein